MRIETQSERYAHVDPALLKLTMQREATSLPTDEEVAAALQRPGIRAGQLTAKVERPGFESGPSSTGRAVIASNDPDMDLFFELSNQGMSMDDIGKEIAKRNYTDNEERKAFRKGWRSGFTGKDATHYDKLTDGWPSNLYHAFFSAYEIVRTYW